MNPVVNKSSNFEYNETQVKNPRLFAAYPTILKPYLEGIFRFPKALELINEVKKQGNSRSHVLPSMLMLTYPKAEKEKKKPISQLRVEEITNPLTRIVMQQLKRGLQKIEEEWAIEQENREKFNLAEEEKELVAELYGESKEEKKQN